MLIALAFASAALVHGAEPPQRQKPLVVPLPEPQIERLSSTRYLVTCQSGRKATITLEGSPESRNSAGPKNPYVLGRAREQCWQGTRQTN
jgi:hypothetical protein